MAHENEPYAEGPFGRLSGIKFGDELDAIVFNSSYVDAGTPYCSFTITLHGDQLSKFADTDTITVYPSEDVHSASSRFYRTNTTKAIGWACSTISTPNGYTDLGFSDYGAPHGLSHKTIPTRFIIKNSGGETIVDYDVGSLCREYTNPGYSYQAISIELTPH